MTDVPERAPPSSSSLRGWLSDVYLTALVSGLAEPLVKRLGDRATVDDPIFGRVSGMPALAGYLEEIATWLTSREGDFQKTAFTMGSDRDVTEGSLSLTYEGKRAKVPVAIVAERRREREIEVRLYYSTKPIRGAHAVRSPLLSQGEVVIPPAVTDHLAALSRGDAQGVLATFEAGGTLRDSGGLIYTKDEGGELRRYYESLVSPGADGGKGVEILPGARADDGRTCVVEYTIVRVRGKAVPPQAGLAVYERGETGLLRGVRVYEDVGV
jgi:hypothetical protein